jgi:hypothetical protein
MQTGWDRVAVEVIREYSANEFIGKLYAYTSLNQWLPMEPSKLKDQVWFSWYQRFPPAIREKAQPFYFDMEGSGRWAILHCRNESDESGPYVAIALRYVQ